MSEEEVVAKEEDEQNQDEGNEESKEILGDIRESDININESKETLGLTGNQDFIEEKCCSMKEGSIQGSVFTLSSIALGTGAFSLPIRCTQIGCVWYSISIFIGAIISYWTLTKLIESAKIVKADAYSTSVRRIIGKIPAIIIDVILMIYLFGIIIQFNVINW